MFYIIDIKNFNIYKFEVNKDSEINNIFYNLFKFAHSLFLKNLKRFFVSKINYKNKEIYLLFILLENDDVLNNFEPVNDIDLLKKISQEIDNFKLYDKSISFARTYHCNQTYDRIKLPYFYHLRQTDKNIDRFIDVLPAGKIFTLKTCSVLHDILEDTSCTFDQLKKEFSNEIAEVVLSVTKIEEYNNSNSDNFEYEEEYYKQVLKNKLGIFVKFADKCANNRQNTRVLSQKRAIKSLKQHEIFKNTIYDKFQYNKIKYYLDSIMEKVRIKNKC